MQRRSQEDRSRTTRAALEQAGRSLFAERGFAATSAEQLVAAAGVTRGALHHHYGDKRGLFLAVLEQIETEATAEIAAAVAAVDPADVVAGMTAGLARFLDLCAGPEMLRVVLMDAPTVLGWPAFREFESRHGLGLITGELQRAVDAGLIPTAPVAVLAQLLLSAITEASLIVAHADDPDRARLETQQSLLLILAGLLRQG
ncbi:TetR/AcrR family transcriptional regulator [Nocardia asteroides NBRC 15531]|uniref:TetR family transcriptional regulator n=1 Tax=Nocardia asteroides NBRC 15531 TaxID=1110697 RepID=U5EAZ4_NOCAS|nr:TetR/AcrR family transcriptional regulator [Nocardia asteroides]TLF63534.1 TetR/AcrR family transcriptional regulator [Nocardia asteroides NBRC 15531]UGT47019.1 TetR/AcrR family transcriptional regulator [Nocardia asteroides]SFM82086.1 transcriptional regulator, TetR family [Nocardia asteroides]VEG34112.1 DNA-binding transcriptional repressor AcrR [Nocardia asteroides]GAD87272.1 putative TetR family transcriptional regulator [Nocardia asteroides NBRC 15531]